MTIFIATTYRISSGSTQPNWRAILGFALGLRANALRTIQSSVPDLDEDLSSEGLLRGAPAPKASVPAK